MAILMTQHVILMTHLPFNVTRRDGGAYLRAASINGLAGECSACWNHWSDSGYTFKNNALWFRCNDGVAFLHTLDLSHPQERQVYELAKAGNLEISYGVNAEAVGTRASVARMQRRNTVTQRVRPIKAHDIGHLSYCRSGDAAYPQQRPVKIIGDY